MSQFDPLFPSGVIISKLRMSRSQLRVHAFALVVALCGTVFGLLGVIVAFILLGHLSNAFFNKIHIPINLFVTGMVVLGFGLGWIIGYKEATKRFPN